MGDRRNTAPQYSAMVASAADLHVLHPSSITSQRWQDEAWRFFDAVGELWYAAQIYGAGLGRARLVAAKRPKPGGEPDIQESGEAAEWVQQIAGSVAGQSELMWNIGLNLTIPGISVIVGQTQNEVTSWQVFTSDSIKTTTQRAKGRETIKTVKVQTGPDHWETLEGDTLMIPVWRQHPRKKWEPDSPARHCLDSLSEIELLSRHIRSTGLSRVASNGLLLYPSEATFKPKAGADTKIDPFTAELLEAAQTAIDQPGSAAAAIPLPVKVPKELIQYFVHLKFATPFDERVLELRESAIRRFAASMDLPAEQLLGMGDMTHWNAWQVSEDTVRIHLIPMLERIAHALTVGYLWPAMGLTATDQPEDIIWVDTSELTVRPDRSKDAMELYDRGEIGPDTLRRETGFSKEDEASEQELQDMAYKKAVFGGTGISLGEGQTGFEERNRESTGPPYSDPETEESTPHDTDPNAEPTTPGNASALIEACDGVVYRALEKVGNRLRSMTAEQRKTNPTFDCPPTTMHCCIDSTLSFREINRLLEGVWDRLPEIAERHGTSIDALQTILTPYLRNLVVNKREHSYEELASALSTSLGLAA